MLDDALCDQTCKETPRRGSLRGLSATQLIAEPPSFERWPQIPNIAIKWAL